MQLRRERSRFDDAGLAIVLIGLGSPEKAAAFRAEFDLPFPVLADPQKRAYAAYGLTYRLNALREAARPDGLVRLARDMAGNGGAASPDQDMLQLGGTFVVDTAGTVRFAYRSLRAADHPEIAAIIAALA